MRSVCLLERSLLRSYEFIIMAKLRAAKCQNQFKASFALFGNVSYANTRGQVCFKLILTLCSAQLRHYDELIRS